jgi:hypothetical protein
MIFLIKFASKGRPAKFIDGLNNIRSTISKDAQYHILCTLDVNEQWANEYNKLINKTDLTNVSFANTEKSLGKIHAINYGVNEYTGKWDCLINFSDDMAFVVNGWDKIISDRIKLSWKDSLDFFAHFNDGFVGDKLPTMSIMGREYYERFFYIYPNCYKSFSCDAEAMYVAMMLNRHKYFPDCLFKHFHPGNMRMATDQTYRENDVHSKQDTEVYFNRLNKNFYVNNPIHVPFEIHKRK